MRKSCGQHLPCICHRNASETETIINIVEFRVKCQIERCLQKYMSFEETMTYLKNTHQTHPPITKTIWEKLVRDNPHFFKAYYLRCETLRQIKIFNSLLEQQATLMLEYGLFDLTNPPPAIANILHQELELYCRALKNRKPSYRSELQFPNNQQPQHHNQWSTPDGFACKEPESVIVHTQGEPLYRIPESEASNNANFGYGTQSMTQNQLDLLRQQQRQDSRVPTVAQAATTAQDPSTSQIRDHIRDNSLRELQTLQLGGSNNRIYSRELFNRLQNGESSDGILNGGSTNGMLNGEKINGIQIGGRTNELLNGGSNNGLRNLANRPSHRSKVNPQSLPLPDTNYSMVNQLQIPNDQQPQRYNQWSTSHDLAYFGVPSFAQAATTAQDPSTSQIRDHTRYNSLSMDNAVLEMQYLPQLQTLEYEGISNEQHYGVINNRLQNAESINGLHYEGRLNGPQGVIPQEQHHFREQDLVTIQAQGSINEMQNGGSTKRLLIGGRINGLPGVIPLNHHLFHDSKIVHAQGEPLYPILESEATNSLDGADSSEMSPPNVALPDTDCLIVNQLQIPNDQQPQHHNQYSRLQTLQYGGNNSELQNGGRIDQQLDLLRQQQRPGP